MEASSIAGFKGNYFPSRSFFRPAPLLFIHGAFADHTGFDKIASLFANDGWSSYAFSRRGRLGQGPEQAKDLTFTDYLQDTLAVIDSIRPAPILIGHSLGGLLAMKAAEERSDVPALVLINSAPPAMLTAQPIALPYFFPLLPKIFLGKPFKPSINALKKLALQMLNENEQQRIAKGLVPESGIVYRQMMLGQIRLRANRKPVPTLVIGSANDRIISKALNKTTVRKAKAGFKEYAGHGHWIIEEAGLEQIVSDISDWLTQVL